MKIRCITNRHLSVRDYAAQITQIAQAGPEAVIVREKDLTEQAYEALAKEVMRICAAYQVPCILHTYIGAAARLGVQAVQLPLQKLLDMTDQQKRQFSVIGASIHSVQEAKLAQEAGAAYLTAGHVFPTECKKGVPARGLPFLQEVCAAVELPVYALGGIHPGNAAACIRAGAAGVCIMSGCMNCADVRQELLRYRDGGEGQ